MYFVVLPLLVNKASWSIMMSISVCLSVCLSARITKTARPNFTKCFCMLPVAVALSSSNGIVICYVLPVLRMRSCFLPCGQWAESSTTLWLEEFARWRYQMDIKLLQCLADFVRMRHWGRSLLSTIALNIMHRLKPTKDKTKAGLTQTVTFTSSTCLRTLNTSEATHRAQVCKWRRQRASGRCWELTQEPASYDHSPGFLQTNNNRTCSQWIFYNSTSMLWNLYRKTETGAAQRLSTCWDKSAYIASPASQAGTVSNTKILHCTVVWLTTSSNYKCDKVFSS